MGTVRNKSLIQDEWNQLNLMELEITLNELPEDKSQFEELLQYYKDLQIFYHPKERKTIVKIMIEIPNHHKKPAITEAIKNYIRIRESEFKENCHYALSRSFHEHSQPILVKKIN